MPQVRNKVRLGKRRHRFCDSKNRKMSSPSRELKSQKRSSTSRGPKAQERSSTSRGLKSQERSSTSRGSSIASGSTQEPSTYRDQCGCPDADTHLRNRAQEVNVHLKGNKELDNFIRTVKNEEVAWGRPWRPKQIQKKVKLKWHFKNLRSFDGGKEGRYYNKFGPVVVKVGTDYGLDMEYYTMAEGDSHRPKKGPYNPPSTD